jgi:NAD(P)-dependent dehydrogenase (short-subunit alcohol dehydrogenase family)
MAIELEPEGIKVNAISPAFTKTNLNGYAGTETVEQGAREAVRVALLGPNGPTGTFTRRENETIPWRTTVKTQSETTSADPKLTFALVTWEAAAEFRDRDL